MLVEFNFDRKNLQANAGEIESYLKKELRKRSYPIPYKIASVTIMSRWLVVLVEFPTLNKHPTRPVEFLWDALAGVVVLNFDVRYRHFTVLGEEPSLIFKEKTQS
jgi:hypothetical protein